MVGDEPLEMHDRHGFIELSPSAYRLALMSADSTAHARKGICLLEYSVSVVEAARSNQGDVSRGIHAHGADVLTGALEKA
jgi:hypothetical protein